MAKWQEHCQSQLDLIAQEFSFPSCLSDFSFTPSIFPLLLPKIF